MNGAKNRRTGQGLARGLLECSEQVDKATDTTERSAESPSHSDNCFFLFFSPAPTKVSLASVAAVTISTVR
jgi:hypothetical protein